MRFKCLTQSLLGATLFCFFVLLTGCLKPQGFRHEADRVAYDVIQQKQALAIGRSEPFWIETPSQTLRRRLIENQMLPTSHPASFGTDRLRQIDHWPEDDYLRSARTDAQPVVSGDEGNAVMLTLIEALQVAARNSRGYQDEKESVFRTALSLDLERDAFRTSWAGAIDNTLSYDSDSSPETATFTTTPRVSFSQSFEDGLDIAGSISWDLIHLLTQGGDASSGVSADLSATLPLLAGSGRHIVRESLTQAERNMIYALWDFERFKRSFVVTIASSYLSVLQQQDTVDNARNNYRSLIDSYQRAQALAEEGRLPEIQVDQAQQGRAAGTQLVDQRAREPATPDGRLQAHARPADRRPDHAGPRRTGAIGQRRDRGVGRRERRRRRPDRVPRGGRPDRHPRAFGSGRGPAGVAGVGVGGVGFGSPTGSPPHEGGGGGCAAGRGGVGRRVAGGPDAARQRHDIEQRHRAAGAGRGFLLS